MNAPTVHFSDCQICGQSHLKERFTLLHEKSEVLTLSGFGEDSLKLKSSIVYCESCRHAQLSPRLSDELMNDYYSVINSEFYHRRSEKIQNLNEKEYQDFIAQIGQHFPPGSRVLEIGCGNGFLLKMLEAAGYEVCGIEPSPTASEYAKETLGLKIDRAFLENSQFQNEKFDVIIAIDVVEHLSDIDGFMRSVKKAMSPGSLVFFGTGDIDSWNARIAGPNWGYFISWEHISFYSSRSMRKMLEKHGFAQIDIQKTSLQDKPMQNTKEFIKNLAKLVVNRFSKKRYHHGICFDHLIATARLK